MADDGACGHSLPKVSAVDKREDPLLSHNSDGDDWGRVLHRSRRYLEKELVCRGLVDGSMSY